MYRVISRPPYFMGALCTSVAVFCIITWWNAVPLFVRIVTDGDVAFDRAVSLASTLLFASFSDYTVHGFVYAAAIAILIGMNATLLTFYFRMFRAAPSSGTAAAGTLGAIAAALGFGCAACGSVFLVSFIGALGGTGLVALLPYGGEEIGYVGMALLAVSALFLSRAINKPAVCPI